MNVYVDFDRTLFDCDKFLEDFYKLVDEYNIPRNVFKECQKKCKKQGFNPYIILKEVSSKCLFDKQIYEDIHNLLTKTHEYLYSDTISFLKYLKDQNYIINILTKGNNEYQKEKIAFSNIDSYYDNLIVTMHHKGSLKLNYHDSIFIDDNPKEIKSILEKSPKKIIRIKRDNSKFYDCTIDDDVITVLSLDEIIKNKLI